MANILDFLAGLAKRDRDGNRIRSEIHGVLTPIRDKSELAERVIPACLEQLTHSEIDDVITGVWLMTARVAVDYDRLLELDALGAALDLLGCVTRIGFHVRDAVQVLPDPSEGEGFRGAGVMEVTGERVGSVLADRQMSVAPDGYPAPKDNGVPVVIQARRQWACISLRGRWLDSLDR